MFVNILTYPMTTFETAPQIDHPELSTNQDDLYKKTAPNHQPSSITLPSTYMPTTNFNSTSDIQSRLNDISWSGLISSHNEPDPSSFSNRLGNVLLSDRLDGSETTKLPAEASTFASTTAASIDDDDELNKHYLQNYVSSNINEVTTVPSVVTFPSSNEVSDKTSTKPETNTHSDSTLTPEALNDSSQASATTTPIPVEILLTSEAKPSLNIQASAPKAQSTTIPSYNHQNPSSNMQQSPLPQISTTFEAQPSFFGKNSIITPFMGSTKPPDHQAKPFGSKQLAPSLADLLQIIKHLNLIRYKPSPLQRPSYSLMDALLNQPDTHFNRRQLANFHVRPHSWLPEEVFRPNLPLADALATAESSLIKIDQPYKKDVQDLRAAPSKNDSPIKLPISSLKTKLHQDKLTNREYVAGKSTKYSLISPYTGNFEAGLSNQNFPINRVRLTTDQLIELEADKTNRRKILYGENSHKFSEASNAPRINDERLNRRGVSSQKISYVADLSEQRPKQPSSRLKPTSPATKASPNRPKSKTINTVKSFDSQTNDNDFNSIRAERNAIDRRPTSDKVLVELKRPTKTTAYDDSNEQASPPPPPPPKKVHHYKDKRDGQAYSNTHQNNQSNKDDDANPDVRATAPPQQQPQPTPQPQQAAMIDQYDGENYGAYIGSSMEQTGDQSPLGGINYQYLDDSNKRSLYNIHEKGLNLDELPRPLTIGELASQHGVPFRLKSPLGEQYHIGLGGLGDRGKIGQETSQYEDYMPYAIPDANSLRLDDELKKKLAMKTIEAIERDPLLTLVENLYNAQHQSPTPSNWQKVYSNPLGSSSLPSSFYRQQTLPSSQVPMNMLPVATIQDQTYMTNPIYPQQDYSSSSLSESNSSTKPVNLMVSGMPYRWALSRMPDLVPIPLAATVPGYLIRLANGQILAAALTNSFSIQGIQKGPLSSGYKNFLNQRLKRLVKQSNQKQAPGYGIGHLAAGSGIIETHVPAPQRITQASVNKGGSEKGGLFYRGVLSQLGFSRSSQRSNTTRDANRTKAGRHKLIKVNNSPSPPLSEQELAALPLANLNEPVFSFADDEIHSLDSPVFLPSPMASSTLPPVISPDAPEMLQNDNTLALKAKLNQLLSMRNLFGDDLIHGTKKRRSPPPGGFEPPTFWLTAKRASRLRHGGMCL